MVSIESGKYNILPKHHIINWTALLYNKLKKNVNLLVFCWMRSYQCKKRNKINENKMKEERCVRGHFTGK